MRVGCLLYCLYADLNTEMKITIENENQENEMYNRCKLPRK